MALTIEHPDADRLARELAERTGESITDAVVEAVRQRLQREDDAVDPSRLMDDLREIRNRCAALPVLDPRTPEEILGYDEYGLPH